MFVQGLVLRAFMICARGGIDFLCARFPLGVLSKHSKFGVRLNAYRLANWTDEDMMGVLSRIGKKCHRMNVGKTLLLRYPVCTNRRARCGAAGRLFCNVQPSSTIPGTSSSWASGGETPRGRCDVLFIATGLAEPGGVGSGGWVVHPLRAHAWVPPKCGPQCKDTL